MKQAKRETRAVHPSPSDRILETLIAAHGEPRSSKQALAHLAEAVGADLGSVFLFDEDGVSLRGAKGVWDWTRTSFRVRIDLWPSVEKAISARRAVCILPAGARGLETDWFEPGGIASSIAAPMVAAGRTVGVLFLDYLRRGTRASTSEIALAYDVATRWAELLVAGRRQALESGIRELKALTSRPAGVADLMTLAPLVIDARVSVQVAQRLMAAKYADCVLVLRDGELAGSIQSSVIESARPSDRLSELPLKRLAPVDIGASAREAANVMLESDASCLTVVDEVGEVVGLVTREQLLTAGFLPGERGIDLCAACGESHDLGARAEDALVFCADCLGVAANDSVAAIYETLGGSG